MGRNRDEGPLCEDATDRHAVAGEDARDRNFGRRRRPVLAQRLEVAQGHARQAIRRIGGGRIAQRVYEFGRAVRGHRAAKRKDFARVCVER